jgi:hypothetical protein
MPRVASLQYNVWSDDERITFAPTAQLQFRLQGFGCLVRDGVLTAIPDEDYPEPDAARADLEPYLEGWSAKAEVVDQVPLGWKFLGSQVEQDRPGDAKAYAVTVECTVGIGSSAAVHVERGDYPAPDPQWREQSPLASHLRQAWRSYRQNGGVLASVVYRMLSVLEEKYERPAIPSQMGFSRGAYDRLHALSGRASERKVSSDSVDLSEEERRWLINAMTSLIRRVHEVEVGVPPEPVLTVSDFED